MKITSIKSILLTIASAALFVATQTESQAQLLFSTSPTYSLSTRYLSSDSTEESTMKTFYIVETYRQIRDVDTGRVVKTWWENEYEGTDYNEASATRYEWKMNLIDGAYFIGKATLPNYTGRLSEEVTYVRIRSEQREVIEELFYIVETYRRIYDVDTKKTIDYWRENEYEGTNAKEAYATRDSWELFLIGGSYMVGKVYLPDYDGRLAEEVYYVRLRSEMRYIEVEEDVHAEEEESGFTTYSLF